MLGPIVDRVIEYGPDQRVLAHAGIESRDQPAQASLGNPFSSHGKILVHGGHMARARRDFHRALPFRASGRLPPGRLVRGVRRRRRDRLHRQAAELVRIAMVDVAAVRTPASFERWLS